MGRWVVAAALAVCYIVLALVSLAAPLLGDGPGHHPVQTGVYTCVYGGVILSTAGALRRFPQRRILLVSHLLAVWVLFVVGDTLSEVVTASQPYRPRQLADLGDVFMLSAYLLVIVVLARHTVRHRHTLDLDRVLDAGIVAVALCTVAWVGLIVPGIRSAAFAQSPGAAVVAALYPALDLVLVVITLTYLDVPRALSATSAVGLLCPMLLLVGDAGDFYNLLLHRPAPPLSHVCWILAFGAAAVAVQVPPTAHLARAREPGGPRRARLPVIYVLGLVPLAMYSWQLLRAPHGVAPRDGTVLAGAMLLMFALVVSRAAGMMRTADHQSSDLEVLARSDHLTGLLNRRSGDAALARMLTRARASGEPLSVTILDLDRFKAFNDTFGHHAGDELLTGCARAWGALLGPAEVLSRYGGEEFLLLTVGLPTGAVIDLVDRMRDATPRGQSFSAGTALWQRGVDAAELVARADEALYAAKANGRARTYLWEVDDGRPLTVTSSEAGPGEDRA